MRLDYPLFFIILGLAVFGLAILASASIVISQNRFGLDNPTYFFSHQLLYAALPGVFLMILISKMDYRHWKKAAVFLLLGSLALLILVFIPPLGLGFRGAKRWINLGFFVFQPSEIAKLSFIIYLAAWLESRKEEVKNLWSGLIPFLVICGLVGVFLVLQPDVGTLGVLTIAAALVYFLAGGRLGHLFFVVLLGVAGLFLLIQFAPYRFDRFTVFLHPETDPKGIGYQINQAKLAVGSGGIFGLGYGQGLQKRNYLPEPISDSIFAIAAEELGLIGAASLVFLFLGFCWRGLKVAKKAPDDFGRLLAAGIVSLISVQAFINIAAILGLLPLTGIPLPFVSYGGTALLSLFAACGILLNISRFSDR